MRLLGNQSLGFCGSAFIVEEPVNKKAVVIDNIALRFCSYNKLTR